MKIHTVYFSPTGNTKKSVNAMAGGLSLYLGKTSHEAAAFEEYDCTCLKETSKNMQEILFSEEDFVVFGAPVYAGRIPEVSVKRFQRFKGNQTPCIIVVSYGNRHYDDALLELKNIVENNGFVVIGGAAVIGRHTYGEIQVDRPNTDDLGQMEKFAIEAYESKNMTLKIPGNSIYREGGKGGKFKPSTLESCIKCGICKRNCPVNAINEQFDVTDEGCISCFRCIRNCPVKAKVMLTESYQQFAADFTVKLSQRKENEFFL